MNKRVILWLATILTVIAYPAEARQERSEAAKNAFKHFHPCPSNNKNHGPCPGYVIDHIKPLACGGRDDPSNMQWQTVAQGKAKDKWERRDCFAGSRIPRLPTKPSHEQNFGSVHEYRTGPRGGCYTTTLNGKKSYVDHSYCDQ